MNKYFADNRDMVLGSHSTAGSMYAGSSYTVKSKPGSEPLQQALASAKRKIAFTPIDFSPPGPQPLKKPPVLKAAPASSDALNARDQARRQGMLEIGDSARKLLDLEKDSGDEDESIEQARTELREQYEAFVAAHSELNAPANRRLMSLEPDAPLLLALENHDKDTGSWEPAAVFSRRVVGSSPQREAANASDALSVVVNETGSLDFDRMGQLLGQSPDSVREALADEGLIFHNPLGKWEPASEYLTGPVREKLQTARRIAAQDTSYQGNVAALEAVQPPDIPAGEIGTPLGAPWIPDSLVNQWVQENWHTASRGFREDWFKYSADIGKWSNPQRVRAYEATLTSEWGTKGMGADKILLHVLQGSPITVTKSDGNGGTVKDLEGTLAAQEKATKMQESFNDWLWKDPERNSSLVRIYNDTHNNTRPRVFDGSHQTFPGMAPHWQEQMREHQRDAIFRVVHDGTDLLAHEVGFGKTAVMVASGMERKRLGLIDKPIFVVPKATHRQFVVDFRKIYPGAKLLSPEDKEFSNENREAFLNRIVTGDWDGVVLTGEQFQKIPVLPYTEAKWTREQLNDLRSALDDLSGQADGGRRRGKSSLTEKQIEKKMETLSVKLQDLHAEMNESRDKRVPYFETLGIDQIYVDEADRYKNLPFCDSNGPGKGPAELRV